MALSSGGRFTQRAVFVHDTIALAQIAQSRGFFGSCGVPRDRCSLVVPFWRWGILQRVWSYRGLEYEGSFGHDSVVWDSPALCRCHEPASRSSFYFRIQTAVPLQEEKSMINQYLSASTCLHRLLLFIFIVAFEPHLGIPSSLET